MDIFRNSVQFDGQTVADFKRFAKVLIDNIHSFKGSPELQLMAHNVGIVREGTAVEELGIDLLSRLTQAGFIERRVVIDYQFVYIPKLPELIAGYSPELVKSKFLPRFSADLNQGYTEFLDACEYLPYGELVAAKVLFELGTSDNVAVFSDILNLLIRDEPSVETSEEVK